MLKKILLGASLSVLPMMVMAQPSYNYIDASFEKLDIDGTPFDGTGIGLEGSLDLGNNYFAEASYFSVDDQGVDVDRHSIAVGTKFFLNQETNWYLKAGFHKYSVGPFDEDGFLIGAGIRSNITDQIELNGSVTFEDVDDGNMIVYKAGALYHVNPTFGAFTELGRNDDGDSYMSLGGRYKF